MSSYGRRRESIADLEVQISDVFSNHPEAHFNDEDTPVIPAHALPGVIAELSLRNGVEILDARELEKVEEFVRDNPVIEVTPELLLGFMAMATAKVGEARNSSPELAEDTTVRGRAGARRFSGDSAGSRSSSRDSEGTSVWYRDSRTRSPDSPFEAKSRKRSAPLAGPPSSWNKRPVPPQRRRSDAGFGGSMSDTESISPTLRASPRTRVPSTPTSPSSRMIGSPTLPPRPHSRAASDATFSIDHSVRRFSSLSPSAVTSSIVGLVSPPPERDNAFSSPVADDSADIISSLTMPTAHGSDSDSDGDGDDTHRLSMGLILDHDRSVRSSVVSLEPHDHLDALQKNNQELARRLVDAERTLQKRLADHEIEIDEMQSKLDELRAELAATKREEKELRSKERQNSQQMQSLESELAQAQKTLGESRNAYHTASKQFTQQCELAEKYRNSLRLRDQEIKDLEDAAQLHQLEVLKWAQQREALENAHLAIERDLSVARQTQVELDEQKQENLVLKETIDRLRFDLDELRTRETHTPSGGVGGTPFGSVSKSLGAELMNRWNALPPDGVNDEEQQEEEDDGSTTDGEEMIQTIITRKKRRVGGGSKVIEFKETKEYSDAYTQHEISEIMPPTAEAGVSTVSASVESFGLQTDPEPVPEPEPKPLLASIEVQTEPEPTADDELGSSSSTLIPPTPKPEPLPRDAPPSYDQTLDREALMRALEGYELDYENIKGPLRAELKIAEATLRQWHKGASIPLAPLPHGVSPEVVEEWARLKKELGAECMVLDKIIGASKKMARTQKEVQQHQKQLQQQPPSSPKKATSRSRRFYNIYNTYFFNKAESGATATSYVAPVLIGFLCSTVVLLALTPASTPYGAVPGMPTYQDRAYWNAFHALDMAGEGFAGGAKSSSDAVWSVLERLLLGGAHVVRRVNIPS